MARKELSSYPPDIWIRELNKEHPSLWTDLRKGYTEPDSLIRLNSGGMELLNSVPDWCIMPTMFPFLVLTARYGESYYLQHMDEIMTIATLYTWRASKGVYRFAQEVYEALIEQPITGNLPCEALHHLPEWAVYVETPGLTFERQPMAGFIAHLDYNLFSRDTELQFAIFAEKYTQPRMVALPLGAGGTLADAMDRVDQTDNLFIPGSGPKYVGSREEYRHTFSCMLQLLLYLCSEEPDMPEIEHPKHRRKLSGSYAAPKQSQVWDVGVRIASVIRRYKDKKRNPDNSVVITGEGGHLSPRPHVRSAHWHTYWTGPRDAAFPDRKPVLRWLPPIPIGIDWKRELPTSIHAVE